MSDNKTINRDADEHYDRRSKNADETFCQSCGAIIKSAAEICPKCGVRQNNVTNAYTTSTANSNVGQCGVIPPYLIKSKTTAAILALLIGGLGAHKFYMGKSGLGILYLLFCWTYIPTIISLVEGIMYLSCSSDEEFTLKYVLTK